MKLSSIVRYLNELESMDFDQIRGQTVHELEAINYAVGNNDNDIGFYKFRIQKQLDSVVGAMNQFGRVLRNLKDELKQNIRNREVVAFKESNDLYHEAMLYDSNEHILNRRLGIDDESNVILRTRLKSYTDWRTPGLIIRPGHETFIEDMVPLDPLYILDANQDLIAPALSKFNEQYRNRLRIYTVNEEQKTMLNELPQQQFGCVFAYNFFNYKSLEVLNRYIREIYDCLRPGGTFIFTYNDCDRAHGVELFEQRYMCYTPGHMIRDHAESVGFDVVFHYIGQGDLAWLELRKPGVITSLRGGQTLAQIVRN